MNKGIVAFLAFACGGVMGFVTGKKLLEQHYNQLVQEEVDSVKQAFRRKATESDSQKNEKIVENVKPAEDKPMERKLNDSTLRALKKDYRAYYPENKATPEAEETTEKETTKPYVISPDEYDTIPGYEAISLTLYADQVVADDDDNAMSEEEIAETITRESLNHFGEYEDDSVFVRNDDMRTDYEILLDERRYADVLKSKPYQNPTK